MLRIIMNKIGIYYIGDILENISVHVLQFFIFPFGTLHRTGTLQKILLLRRRYYVPHGLQMLSALQRSTRPRSLLVQSWAGAIIDVTNIQNHKKECQCAVAERLVIADLQRAYFRSYGCNIFCNYNLQQFATVVQ